MRGSTKDDVGRRFHPGVHIRITQKMASRLNVGQSVVGAGVQPRGVREFYAAESYILQPLCFKQHLHQIQVGVSDERRERARERARKAKLPLLGVPLRWQCAFLPLRGVYSISHSRWHHNRSDQVGPVIQIHSLRHEGA